MIFDMTLKEYEEFINSEMDKNILDQIYISPKFIKKDSKLKILYKRDCVRTFLGAGTLVPELGFAV